YVRQALPPVLVSLLLLWVWLAYGPGSRAESPHPGPLPAGGGANSPGIEEPAFDVWQTTKGLGVAAALLLIFLFTDWPRDVAALVGAGVLLLSRRLQSARVMGLIDWPLLILFMGLFVVNHAFGTPGLAGSVFVCLMAQGVQ